ncbi:MAG: DUF4363 family protein [Clostridia bacterium]
MRVKLIATLLVLILSVALCVASMQVVFHEIVMMEDLTEKVLERASAGDTAGAREALAQMAEKWEGARPMLEALTPHEDLHQVTLQYVEATSNLESGDWDDFARAMALLKEMLKHLHEHEELSWSNLF